MKAKVGDAEGSTPIIKSARDFSLDSTNRKADHDNNKVEDGKGSIPCHNFGKPAHDINSYSSKIDENEVQNASGSALSHRKRKSRDASLTGTTQQLARTNLRM